MTPTEILLGALEEAGPFVLASPEDAAFFRSSFIKKVEAPAPVIAIPKPVEIKPIPEPVLPPKPAPVAITPPAPKPVIKQEVAPAPLHEEPIPVPTVDFGALRNLLGTIAPELAILNEIPNDLMARKISERWKTKNQSAPISILCWQEPPEQRALLEQIARALDVYFGGAKIVHVETIEKEKQWEAFLSVADLKMVIVCDYTLWQLNGLMQFYKETPGQGSRMLGNTPLFLLPDLALYLKDHLLKRSLWKALCQKFS